MKRLFLYLMLSLCTVMMMGQTQKKTTTRKTTTSQKKTSTVTKSNSTSQTEDGYSIDEYDNLIIAQSNVMIILNNPKDQDISLWYTTAVTPDGEKYFLTFKYFATDDDINCLLWIPKNEEKIKVKLKTSDNKEFTLDAYNEAELRGVLPTKIVGRIYFDADGRKILEAHDVRSIELIGSTNKPIELKVNWNNSRTIPKMYKELYSKVRKAGGQKQEEKKQKQEGKKQEKKQEQKKNVYDFSHVTPKFTKDKTLNISVKDLTKYIFGFLTQDPRAATTTSVSKELEDVYGIKTQVADGGNWQFIPIVDNQYNVFIEGEKPKQFYFNKYGNKYFDHPGLNSTSLYFQFPIKKYDYFKRKYKFDEVKSFALSLQHKFEELGYTFTVSEDKKNYYQVDSSNKDESDIVIGVRPSKDAWDNKLQMWEVDITIYYK